VDPRNLTLVSCRLRGVSPRAGEHWRSIDCGAVTPFENAAVMPVLSRNVAGGADPIATTSVWGQTHLNVGWFDDVDSTLDLDACTRLGVAVIRRPLYGGGTAFYDAGCAVMWGFLLPKERYSNLDAALERFQPVLLDTMAKIGLGEVVFEGSSDLRWHGRKLGALTAQDVVACNSVGGFLNISPPDLDLYLQVVRVPDDKFKDKVVKDMREYVCTAQEVAGRPVTYEEFRDALLTSLEAAGIALEPSELTDGERHGLEKIGGRVGSDDMVRRVSSERFTASAPDGSAVGFGNHKGRKLCRAGVALDGDGVIVCALMAGDMHVSPPDTIDRVADALVGARAGDRVELRRRIASVFDGDDVRQAEATMGVTTDDLLAAVDKAITNATAITNPAIANAKGATS
jgi:lipoate-protein ligase A